VSAAAGRDPDDSAQHTPRLQAMIVTTDAPVPHAVLDQIVARRVRGRTIAL
jgi:hypothetical protein